MDSVFAFEKPVLELLLRGTLAYLAIVFVLRVIPKRHLSNLSPNDFIALVIIGGLTTDAIGGGSSSMLDYLLMAVVVIVWSYLIDLFEFRFPGWRRLTRDSPTLVVHMGKPVRANMRRERLTAEELAASLRAQGVDDVATVKQAILEVDGQLSVIRFENGESPEGRPGGDAGG
ncbi:MAG TPA: YetF domain-containing protein [Trueperaceae bacterium]|nr:YetF domain-containing protein [Trueperaceae bacterium]